jgi:hypothetical protein
MDLVRERAEPCTFQCSGEGVGGLRLHVLHDAHELQLREMGAGVEAVQENFSDPEVKPVSEKSMASGYDGLQSGVCLVESVLKELAMKIKFLRFITEFLMTCKTIKIVTELSADAENVNQIKVA